MVRGQWVTEPSLSPRLQVYLKLRCDLPPKRYESGVTQAWFSVVGQDTGPKYLLLQMRPPAPESCSDRGSKAGEGDRDSTCTDP